MKRMPPTICENTTMNDQRDVAVTIGRGLNPPGGQENVNIIGDDGMEWAYVSLVKAGGQGADKNEYVSKGSIAELLGTDVRTGCSTMELHGLEIRYKFKDATDWISAGVISSFETNITTENLGLRLGNLSASANITNTGIVKSHVFEMTSRMSNLIQPTSGEKPMIRLQVQSTVAPIVIVKFKALGGRVWTVTKN
jgi:hypothetical protein